MDLIVRQAAECGVSRVVPFASERSVTEGARQARWERIIREARQQSGSPVDTRVLPPGGMNEALAFWAAEKQAAETRSVIFSTRAATLHDATPRAATLHDVCAAGNNKKIEKIALAVGCEGGFADKEEEVFINAGFTPINWGANILRCETASLYAIAAVKTLFWEKESWTRLQQE
jgi:16S rRNA (uracil1498-N3)-methyltransferase